LAYINSTRGTKIINDPIYGFISLEFSFLFDLIEHPYVQRLRQIQQLGLTNLVYPGAVHNRFAHALGATYLVGKAIRTLRLKNVEISDEEYEAVSIAVLLHDIGHGPYSHTLESTLLEGVDHEFLSLQIMNLLNEEFEGRLSMAIKIFTNSYEKKFLNQLVSSQLDVDRLDYLKRDSFYSGVSEGVVSSERIIKMFNVMDGSLVVDEKGIYSIEKFIVARRLMYWQVYLHKTVISAEHLLIIILKRAKELAENGVELFCSPSFRVFLYYKLNQESILKDPGLLKHFLNLSDLDVMGAIKVWQSHSDTILSYLCRSLIDRKLFKVQISKQVFEPEFIDSIKNWISDRFGNEWIKYLLIEGMISNSAYDHGDKQIFVKMKNGELLDFPEASDNLDISALSEPVEKYFICYPKSFANS
jgi:HD superfamily phosphohydrolase